MDKWVSYQETESYRILRSKLIKDIKPNNAALEIPTFEDHSKYFRTEFLNQLLAILERSGHAHPCMVIFCCNNFDTIFGNVDMKHYHSLNDRFKKHHFELCQPEEIKDYLRYNNQKFSNSRLYVPDSDLEHILLNIPNRSLTYRKLDEINDLKASNPLKIVQEIQLYDSTFNPNVISSSSNSYNDGPQSSSSIGISYLYDFDDYCFGTYKASDKNMDENGILMFFKCVGCSNQNIICCCDKCNVYSEKTGKYNCCHWCNTKENPLLNPTEYIPFDIIQEHINSLVSKLSDLRKINDKDEFFRVNLERIRYLTQDNVVASCRYDDVYKCHRSVSNFVTFTKSNLPMDGYYEIDASIESNIMLISAFIAKWRLPLAGQDISSLRDLISNTTDGTE